MKVVMLSWFLHFSVARRVVLPEAHRVPDVPATESALTQLEAHVATNSTTEAQQPKEVNVLHHNPHWECFSRDETGQCGIRAHAQYSGFLATHRIDFGSLVMGGDYQPPAGYKAIDHTSGRDTVMLVYNDAVWTLEDNKGFHLEKERAFLAARFRHKRYNQFTVVVISAHYSHHLHGRVSSGANNIGNSVRKLKNGETERVVLLADTNQEQRRKGARELLSEIGASTQAVWGDDVVGACCLDSSFAGPGLSYDRTVANFGTRGARIDDPEYVKITNNYKDGPAWAKNAKKWGGQVAAYHHPIMLKVTL